MIWRKVPQDFAKTDSPDTISEFGDTSLPITVAILEDEPEVRLRFEDAIRLHPRLSHIFSASHVSQAIGLASARPADVYLIDLGLPDRDGRDFIRWLVAQQPDALPMVVTVFEPHRNYIGTDIKGARLWHGATNVTNLGAVKRRFFAHTHRTNSRLFWQR